MNAQTQLNNYREDVADDLMDQFAERLPKILELTDFDTERATDWLQDHAIAADVTGNLTGSYFCDTAKARDFFENSDGKAVLRDAYENGLVPADTLADWVVNDQFEALDVTAREMVLFDACKQVIEDFVITYE